MLTINDMIMGGLVAAGSGLVGVVTWLIRQKMKRWDDHLVQCQEKSVNHARLEEKVVGLKTEIGNLKEHVDTRIDALGDKMDAMMGTVLERIDASR